MGFHETMKLVHFVPLDVYMCADSNTVFGCVEEPIHLSRRGTENENENENFNADENFPPMRMRRRDPVHDGHGIAADLWPGTKSGESGSRQGTSFQRRNRGGEHSVHRRPGRYR